MENKFKTSMNILKSFIKTYNWKKINVITTFSSRERMQRL